MILMLILEMVQMTKDVPLIAEPEFVLILKLIMQLDLVVVPSLI